MIVRTAVGREVAHVGAVLLVVLLLIWPRHDAVWSVPIRQAQAERSWPMFGGTPARNMVNTNERDLPADWCIQEGNRKKIRWQVELGDVTSGSPVIADGKVFIATNNANPRDPKVQGNKAVLMAFRESDGRFLWQIAHDLPAHRNARTAEALPSTPAVVGGHLFYVTSAGEVVCADANRGKVLWRYDMIEELKIHQYQEFCFQGRACPFWSSPLVISDLVFAATGNGIDVLENLVAPKAPSFIALDKRTGKLIWQSNLPGANIIQGEWSSPAFSDHGGRRQVIFAGGDGVVYSFVPETGALLWKCDCLPERKKPVDSRFQNQFVGAPVIVGDKLYIGMGLAPYSYGEKPWSYFLCLDITKKGNVSLKSYDAKAVANNGSALVWAYGGPVEPRLKNGPRGYFGRTISTAAVHEGLIYITEEFGYLHCLDAATGSRVWVHDLGATVLGSPYLTDDRVFVATEDGEVLIFAHQRASRVIATIDMEEPLRATPVATNGKLYLATRSKLFSIGSR